MNAQTASLIASVQHLRPVQYPQIDIQPMLIQYMFSFILILIINLFVAYQFCLEMWRVYEQNQVQNIIHDIYDKVILHSSLKYVLLNIICLIYFHDLTSPPTQLFKVFWLYSLAIVFMKFDIKQILIPALGLFTGLLLLSIFWISIWGQIPAFKLILVQSFIIIFYGLSQAYKVTKIFNAYYKSKNKNMELSVQALLQKNKMQRSQQYDEYTMNLQLDQHVIGHLQNRRSFCVVFSIVLIIELILLLDLEAGKSLFGQVLLSLILDILPLYITYWYLKKNLKQKQSLSQKYASQMQDRLDQINSKRSSKIVIEMVSLKN